MFLSGFEDDDEDVEDDDESDEDEDDENSDTEESDNNKASQQVKPYMYSAHWI